MTFPKKGIAPQLCKGTSFEIQMSPSLCICLCYNIHARDHTELMNAFTRAANDPSVLAITEKALVVVESAY